VSYFSHLFYDTHPTPKSIVSFINQPRAASKCRGRHDWFPLWTSFLVMFCREGTRVHFLRLVVASVSPVSGRRRVFCATPLYSGVVVLLCVVVFSLAAKRTKRSRFEGDDVVFTRTWKRMQGALV